MIFSSPRLRLSNVTGKEKAPHPKFLGGGASVRESYRSFFTRKRMRSLTPRVSLTGSQGHVPRFLGLN
jgi:hypothetical protein